MPQHHRADILSLGNQFGGMEAANTQKLKDLESENAKLKRLAAEQLLVIDGLKEFNFCKYPGSSNREY